ncbi:uracil-DNA glycosylase [Nibricoccus sp. IMCC34717]|uniref:uracil-DNA glycosylase n=1 Tax=Nibricoccus sp. IMCC34717 TaxID=3034021 RepID=UPI00384D72D1
MIPPLPASWLPLLGDACDTPSFRELAAFLENEDRNARILPEPEFRFAALESTPPEAVKVVIVGQDPYPTFGHAHGLAFSVREDVRPLPRSLRNIFKELEADLGIPPAPNGNLLRWARSGVLLLNTVLTVREGEAASHQKRGWEPFTDHLLRELNRRDRRIVFLLWGRHAQAKRALVTNPAHAVIETAHPSPLSARLFFGCRCFSKANALLAEAGLAPVEW